MSLSCTPLGYNYIPVFLNAASSATFRFQFSTIIFFITVRLTAGLLTPGKLLIHLYSFFATFLT